MPGSKRGDKKSNPEQLRVCANCDWIYSLKQFKKCPKCGSAETN